VSGVAAVPAPGVRDAAARVVVLAETYHPLVGGGETQARLLAERLAVRGHEITVLTRRWDPTTARRELVGGVHVRRIPPGGPGGNKRWPMVPFAARELWRMRRRVDVALVLGFRALGLAAIAAKRAYGLPCVFKAESNGEWSGEFLRPGLARFGLAPESAVVAQLLAVRNRALQHADAFVALSSEIERELVAGGVEPDRIRRIGNGVDTARFRPVSAPERTAIRRALGFGADEALVTYTGRLVSYKGLPLLLRVWREIVAELADARLVLVGEGGGDIQNCEAELRDFVAANGMQDRVVFTGAVGNVHELLQASDVFVFPTENEAFGLSLVEAMACGLPCVAAAVGGVPDIVVDGRNGVLVPPGDGAALRQRLLQLLRERRQAAALGRAARATVLERYSADAVTDAYEALIEGASAGTRPKRSRPACVVVSGGAR
jgi:glycosyltransferase involved in cell wall biosynthesis